MCGIAGVLTPDRGAAALTGAVSSMLAAIRHRGPDDEGTWSAASGQAAFAHARLSIIDLSPAGRQPMVTSDGRFTVTFNGEIYNFMELRRSLERRGVRFQTRSDTEVILRAYEADGPSCFAALRGMFALALWDERDRTCVLARDRFGIKPCYYHSSPQRLVFASEIRALLASRLVPRDLDADGVFGYLRTGSVPEPHTMLKGVRCLEPGHYAIWRNGELAATPYWELKFGASGGSYEDHVAVTREALLDAVEHHFVSDTPVGVFLSGGIDSTVLVALATAIGRKGVHTFSVSFPGLPEDEGAAARRTAEHFQTTHAEWAIDAITGRQLFANFLRVADQPSIDGLNTLAVSKFARDRGMKVVLSGLGGDELFAGYPSFDEVPRLAGWNRALSLTGPLRRAAGRGIERTASDPRWRRVGDLLSQPPDLFSAYTTFRGVFTRAEARRLVERYTTAGATPLCLPHAPEADDPTVRDRVSRLELSRYMRNQPLRDSDTMSMAYGLELRVPFLDGPLVDTVARIPARDRLRAGKQLLLSAVPEVPDWVAGMPKRGFIFPFERWMADEWRETFAGLDRDCPVPTQTWYRKWCVFVLDRWVERLGSVHG